jgi:hypothetical protein
MQMREPQKSSRQAKSKYYLLGCPVSIMQSLSAELATQSGFFSPHRARERLRKGGGGLPSGVAVGWPIILIDGGAGLVARRFTLRAFR